MKIRGANIKMPTNSGEISRYECPEIIIVVNGESLSLMVEINFIITTEKEKGLFKKSIVKDVFASPISRVTSQFYLCDYTGDDFSNSIESRVFDWIYHHLHLRGHIRNKEKISKLSKTLDDIKERIRKEIIN